MLLHISLAVGATTSGAKGFFQGVGRGALSILTKPTLGVVELAYYTLEGVRRWVSALLSTKIIRSRELLSYHHSVLYVHVSKFNLHSFLVLQMMMWRLSLYGFLG